MRTLLLSTLILGAWTAAASAEPAARTPTVVKPAAVAVATAGRQAPQGRVELADGQMDKVKAGGFASYGVSVCRVNMAWSSVC